LTLSHFPEIEDLLLPFFVVRISPSQVDEGRFFANGKLYRTIFSEASLVNCEELGYRHPLLKLDPSKDERSKQVSPSVRFYLRWSQPQLH
jgi:flagellar motor protein MotB